jgi:hypothetical protein
MEIGKLKPMMMLLINLCYLVRVDRSSHFTKEEFTSLAKGILGDEETKYFEEELQGVESIRRKYEESNSGAEAGEEEESLLSLIYNRISNNISKKKYNKLIKKFFEIFELMGKKSGNKLNYDFALVNIFNNFILDITGKNKKLYLVKFEVV